MTNSGIQNLFKIVRSGSRSLAHQKLRAALSVSGIVCGITAVFTMICIGEGAKRAALAQIAELGVNNIIVKEKKLTRSKKGRAIQKLSRGLTMLDVSQIEATLPSLLDVAALKEVRASTANEVDDFSPVILAVTPEFLTIKNLTAKRGRLLHSIDISEKRLVAVIGKEVAERTGTRSDPGGFLRIEDSLFSIIGILETYSTRLKKGSPITVRNFNQAIFIPLGVEKSINTIPPHSASPGLTEIIIKTESKTNVITASKIVSRGLQLTHSGVDDYSVIVPEVLLRQMMRVRHNFNILLGSIAIISLLAGGIGIMNIMLATVSERRREIGIRRAVGAGQGHILFQFLSESLFLTITGGIVGLFLGFIIVRVLALYTSFEPAVVPASVILPLGMATLTGLFFGLYPALRASKVDPITALRYE